MSEENKETIRLCTTLATPGSTKSAIICFYHDIIDNAERNIGKMTTNGVLITELMVRLFKERRTEIFHK